MPTQSLKRPAILMLVLVLISLVCWEFYLRHKGFDTSYNDDGSLWADKRKMVYEPMDKTTVFIGSSRIKFDTDINNWETNTGEHAVQLACVGSTPLPVLDNLAKDEKFKGKLVIDVVEGLFFSLHEADEQPLEKIKYYKEETPAQWASFQINHILESQLVFLDKEWNSMGAYLKQIPLKNRNGVHDFKGFPSDFGRVKFNRQEYMTNKMAHDTAIQGKVIRIWQMFRGGDLTPPITGKPLDSLFTAIKFSIDKIRARGGKVIFIRPPSSGTYREAEKKYFPREKYWDQLLKATQTPGIYYEDYPVLAKLQCPEESHLDLSDATVFTKEIIRLLKERDWFTYAASH